MQTSSGATEMDRCTTTLAACAFGVAPNNCGSTPGLLPHGVGVVVGVEVSAGLGRAGGTKQTRTDGSDPNVAVSERVTPTRFSLGSFPSGVDPKFETPPSSHKRALRFGEWGTASDRKHSCEDALRSEFFVRKASQRPGTIAVELILYRSQHLDSCRHGLL
jgi:hypothetical protein